MFICVLFLRYTPPHYSRNKDKYTWYPDNEWLFNEDENVVCWIMINLGMQVSFHLTNVQLNTLWWKAICRNMIQLSSFVDLFSAMTNTFKKSLYRTSECHLIPKCFLSSTLPWSNAVSPLGNPHDWNMPHGRNFNPCRYLKGFGFC